MLEGAKDTMISVVSARWIMIIVIGAKRLDTSQRSAQANAYDHRNKTKIFKESPSISRLRTKTIYLLELCHGRPPLLFSGEGAGGIANTDVVAMKNW